MKIKQGFVVKNVGDMSYVVATGALTESFNAMIQLNGTGKFLWELLEDGSDVDSMVKAMTDRYDVDEATARHDVEAFVKVLSQNGIFED